MLIPGTVLPIFVEDAEEKKPLAAVLDEQAESAERLTRELERQGYAVLAERSLDAFEQTLGVDDARLALLAVSTTLPPGPGAQAAPLGIDALRERLFNGCPAVPIVLIGVTPPDWKLAEVDAEPCILARLERPLDGDALAGALERCAGYMRRLDRALQRRFFSRHREFLTEPIARILHDLNNQITAMKGGIDLVGLSVGKIDCPEVQQKMRRYVNEFIRPSLAQIEHMVMNWRCIRERQLRTSAPVDLTEAARRAIAMAGAPALRGRVTLAVGGRETALWQSGSDGAEALLCVLGNAEQLTHAIGSILENAFDAIEGKADGRVLVEISQNDEMGSIAISDNGEGVPPEILSEIWRSFFTTKGANRTGLGLSVAKQVVEKFQGSVTCGESSLGGARFEILLLRSQDGRSQS